MAKDLFKIVLLGPAKVGKTQLICKGCNSTTQFKTYERTIGVEYLATSITLSGVNKRLAIWDTAGEERFREIVAKYIKGSDIIMICMDKDANWSEVMKRYQGILDDLRSTGGDAKIMLVVTKAENDEPFDAILKLREAIKSDSELNERCEDEIYYTNAETGHNVQKLFQQAAIIVNDADLSNDSVKQHDDDADLRKNGSVEQHLDLTEFVPSDVHTAKRPSLFFNLPTLVGTTTGILAGLTIDGALLGALFFTTTLIVTMPYVAAVVCAAILLGTLLVGMSAGIGYAAYDNHKSAKPHMA